MYSTTPFVAMDDLPASDVLKIMTWLISDAKIGLHLVIEVCGGVAVCTLEPFITTGIENVRRRHSVGKRKPQSEDKF